MDTFFGIEATSLPPSFPFFIFPPSSSTIAKIPFLLQYTTLYFQRPILGTTPHIQHTHTHTHAENSLGQTPVSVVRLARRSKSIFPPHCRTPGGGLTLNAQITSRCLSGSLGGDVAIPQAVTSAFCCNTHPIREACCPPIRPSCQT